MVTTLQDSSRHQLGAAAVELHEAEKTMENNLASKDGRITPSWHEMPAILASLCHCLQASQLPGFHISILQALHRETASFSVHPGDPCIGKGLAPGNKHCLGSPERAAPAERGLGLSLPFPCLCQSCSRSWLG